MAANQFGSKSIGEEDWKPHNINIHSNCNVTTYQCRKPGPDWTLGPRFYRKDIKNDPNSLFEEILQPLQHKVKNVPVATGREFYSTGAKWGKKYIFDGHHLGNKQTIEEMLLEKTMGTHTKVIDSRGNIPCRSLGDKSYKVPEYCENFHKKGSTRPAVDFSCSLDPVTDTFIPLQRLPSSPSLTFKQKEHIRLLLEEQVAVERLDTWTPAPPLLTPLLPTLLI